jgi:hypothetical protein
MANCVAQRAPVLVCWGAQPARSAAWAWSAPTPPWPGGPKSGRRRPARDSNPGFSRPAAATCAASRQRERAWRRSNVTWWAGPARFARL